MLISGVAVFLQSCINTFIKFNMLVVIYKIDSMMLYSWDRTSRIKSQLCCYRIEAAVCLGYKLF